MGASSGVVWPPRTAESARSLVVGADCASADAIPLYLKVFCATSN